MRIVVLIFCCFIYLGSRAQQVQVFERGLNFPIENVTIFNESNKTIVYTDKDGFADLSEFDDLDVLTFYHLSFEEFEILKKELALIEYKVFLSKRLESLDEVILAASKGVEKRSRVAEQVEISSRNEIRQLAPQTSADLLATIPGVRVQKSQFGGGSPVLRGMEANRVLLVVDGVRMNNAIYRMGHLQNSITVSPNLLERTEVLFGPSSVIYGSDALGGVIHYYTKTPRLSEESIANVQAYSRVNSVNEEFSYDLGIELRNKKWASYTHFSRSKFGDLRMGKRRNHNFEEWGKVYLYSTDNDGRYSDAGMTNSNPDLQRNTGYDQNDFMQKLVVPIRNDNELILNFQLSESSSIHRFDKLNEFSGADLKYAEWHYGPQRRLLTSAQYKISTDKDLLENGTITMAYQNIEESRIQRKMGSLERSYRNEEVDVFSLNGDFSVRLSRAKNRILSYGFEYTYNDVSSESIGKVLNVLGDEIRGFTDTFIVQSRYPDGGSSYENMAGYINYRQAINKKSTLNTGIRVVDTQLKARWIDDTYIQLEDDEISLNNTALTATLGYAFKPTDDWQWNMVLSSGFRSPNIDDVGKVREKSGKVTVPNTSLRPEYAYNVETGLLKYFNNRTIHVGLNFYHTLLDNYITRDYFSIDGVSTIMYDGELGDVVANVNRDRANIYGSTLSFKGQLRSNWFTEGSVTFTKGKAKDTDEPLSSIPPLFGSIELGFERDRLKSSLIWTFNGKKRYKDYNIREGIDNIEQTPFSETLGRYYGNPAWNIVGIKSVYKVNSSITLFGAVDNLFDLHYKEFASSISAPGRNFSLAVLVGI